MKEQCKQAVAKALGKDKLNQKEVENIEQRINDAMKAIAKKDIQTWRNLSELERLVKAGEFVAQDIQAQLKKKHKIAAQDVLTQSKNLALLDHPSLPASEVVDRMIAAHGDMSGIQSIDSKARAISNIYRGRLVDMYTNIKGGLGIFTDKDLVQKIITERFGENTGDPLAKKISDELGGVLDDMRERFNRSGGDIGKLDNWGLPQNHSLEKITKVGKDAWVKIAEKHIDTSKYVKEDGSYYSQKEIRDLLEYSYETITMNGANKTEIGRQSYGGGSKITSRHSESRVLHFKDANAWMEYQAEFGGMPFVDLIEAHINGLSKDIALVESLGSNPQGAMKILMDAADKKDREKGLVTQENNKTLKRAESMFAEFMGENKVHSELMANVGIAYRAINVASMLGGTTISSATDQAMLAKTAHVHGLAWHKAFGEMLSQMNPKNKEDRKLAHSLGLATEEMLGSIARWSDDGLTAVHSKSQKIARVSSTIATQVLRASGLNALTAATKVGMSKLLMNKYGELSRTKSWSELSPSDRDVMSRTGLSERAWDVMRLAEPVLDRKGNKLMSARSIYEIPNEKLVQFGDPIKVKDEIASQFQAHLLDEQGMAVTEAGLREKTMMSAGQKKGTVMGEIVKSMLQFKSFSVTLMMRHGSRAMAQPTTAGKANYAISLMAMTTVLGGLVVQLRELANGNDPSTMWDGYDPSKALDFFKRSFVAGGGMPILGDILVAGMDTSGRDASDFIAGPIGSDFKTALALTVGNATRASNGVETNAGNELFKYVKSKVPAQNLWYTKAATNRLIFNNFQDMIAPGYREKLQRKAERHHGRTQFWGDDLSDIRTPDFGKMVE